MSSNGITSASKRSVRVVLWVWHHSRAQCSDAIDERCRVVEKNACLPPLSGSSWSAKPGPRSIPSDEVEHCSHDLDQTLAQAVVAGDGDQIQARRELRRLNGSC